MSSDSARTDRAIGAMIFAAFGAAWLEAWVWLSQPEQWWRYLLVAAGGAALLGLALRSYRRQRGAELQSPPSAQQRRNGRLFHIINIGQWVVILIGANVLNNIGLGAWDIPFIILVIGAHFLPLAHLFRRPGHYLTGMAMVLFAVVYPFTAAGPRSTLGPLGAGLILWASALWALWSSFRSAPPGYD
ncbi:MAG TPA: hypothetical protein VK700_16520 [Steroidobacteraceae bacterium]|jgi:hypothetical protein|nr:hypothetical protein [Steroidobacteraceae bacterium]